MMKTWLAVGVITWGATSAVAAPDPGGPSTKPPVVGSELRGPAPEVLTSKQLALPPVPTFEIPVSPAGMHGTRELVVAGKPLLNTEITVAGYVIWIYDCLAAVQKPGASRAQTQKLIDDDPTLCERKKIYLGDTKATPPEKGLWVVDVPRAPNKLEKERLGKADLAAWPKVPDLKVGAYVAITGTFALSSPHSERNSDGLLVWKSFQASTPTPLKMKPLPTATRTLPAFKVPPPATGTPSSQQAKNTSVKSSNEGTKAYGQKQFQVALDHYRDAVKVWDGNHVAWYGMAGVQIGLGDWPAAVDAMKHAFELVPTDPQYAMVYGYTLYEAAVASARTAQARREGRTPEEVSVDLSTVNADLAEQVLRTATTLNNELWRAHYYLGRIARDTGRAKLAADEFSMALARGPSLSGPYVALAELYRTWQRPDLALVVAQLGTQQVTGAEGADVWYEVGMSYDDQRQDDKAIEALTKALDARTDHAKARFQRGQVYFRRGKKAPAKKDLEDFVRTATGGMQFAKEQANKMLMELAAKK